MCFVWCNAVRPRVCGLGCMYVCVCAGRGVCMDVCVRVGVYVCMCAGRGVCMYVCMCNIYGYIDT